MERDDAAAAAAAATAAEATAPFRYCGWDASVTNALSDLVHEILLHAHPAATNSRPTDHAATPPVDRTTPVVRSPPTSTAAHRHRPPSAASGKHRRRAPPVKSSKRRSPFILDEAAEADDDDEGDEATSDDADALADEPAGNASVPPPPTSASAPTSLDQEIAQLEGATHDADVRQLCLPLDIDQRCNLCAIVAICLKKGRQHDWLLDYSLLCYRCSAAPRTALATLIVAAEFLHLLRVHFTDVQFEHLFRTRILTIMDFHAHFFINRCYVKQEDDAIQAENITLNHMNVVKNLLFREETVPYSRRRGNRQFLPPAGPAAAAAAGGKKRGAKETADAAAAAPAASLATHGPDAAAVAAAATAAAATATKTAPPLPRSAEAFLERHGYICQDRFIELLFYMWSGTNVMFNTRLTQMAIDKHRDLATLRDERSGPIEKCLGPIYLSPTPTFALKNQTTPVCLLCELMACSYYDNHILQQLKRRIETYCHNNLKLVDRIQLALAEIVEQLPARAQSAPWSLAPLRGERTQDLTATLYAHFRQQRPRQPVPTHSAPGDDDAALEIDLPLMIILKQVGVHGIYKHFYCDPLCAANIRATRHDLLFRRTVPRHLPELKLLVCYTNHYISNVHRVVWLYAQTFKAFQVTKRSWKTKTQLGDFVRELVQLLDAHGIHLVDPGYVVDKYV